MNEFSMTLSDADVRRYIQISKEKLGVELDVETARTRLNKLVMQMYRVYQPITADQAENLNNETDNEQQAEHIPVE